MEFKFNRLFGFCKMLMDGRRRMDAGVIGITLAHP